MNLRAFLATALFAALIVCATASIDHDKVQPIPQPTPATISEKAAVKFKPQLLTLEYACVSFPAVNEVGETTGGLKGTNGNDACTYAALGSQIYGRAGWYKNLWAMMFAWYFPKGFKGGDPSRRHDWKSVVVWIDNPALETPKIVGVSKSKSDSEYDNELKIYPSYFAGYALMGTRYNRTEVYGSNTSLRFEYDTGLFGGSYLDFATFDGEYQDLIMWEQLTDAARGALNDGNNFGSAEVPFSDEHYQNHLDNAYLN
ncbi:hypothetical protein PHMEG_00030685 [Phytophthora megakarya]|uniref:Necrosis inducing protein NPP1 n=1 Tax=Phytophthora megakarya TaxID=4795 RepID=A0A225UZT5_9STRA|nr:hypothetical protein PHMEG_00030685 [Phytophthora megakarya]